MPYFTGSPSLQAQSAGQAFPAALGNHHHGYEALVHGESDGVKDPFEDIRQWRTYNVPEFLPTPELQSCMATGAHRNSDTMFSNARDPLASHQSEFMYYPDSPAFHPGDLLTQHDIGSFSTSLGHPEPPLMEFSASSGAATGSLHDFPGSEGSMPPSPHFFQAESSPERDAPYLDMFGVGQAPWSPASGDMKLTIPTASATGPMLPPAMVESPTDFSPAGEFTSNFANEDGLLVQFPLESQPFGGNPYDCIDLGRLVQEPSPFGRCLNPFSAHLQLEENYPTGSQPPLGAFGPTYGLPPRTKAFYSNRLSSDGESIKARQHELYNVVPGPDNMYHCPLVSNGACRGSTHKLKCNYEYERILPARSAPNCDANSTSKHMDSHLKPYRCQDPQCADVPFSSTACLLRHEREAHGLHGHGNRPYSCHFEDCERAAPENGFPRRWNLQDHMRRVHNYVEPETENTSKAENNRVRKKKNSATPSTSARRGSRPLPVRSRA